MLWAHLCPLPAVPDLLLSVHVGGKEIYLLGLLFLGTWRPIYWHPAATLNLWDHFALFHQRAASSQQSQHPGFQELLSANVNYANRNNVTPEHWVREPLISHWEPEPPFSPSGQTVTLVLHSGTKQKLQQPPLCPCKCSNKRQAATAGKSKIHLQKGGGQLKFAKSAASELTYMNAGDSFSFCLSLLWFLSSVNISWDKKVAQLPQDVKNKDAALAAPPASRS